MDLNELNGKSFTLWLTDESNESAVYGRWVARAHQAGLVLERGADESFEVQQEWQDRIQKVESDEVRKILMGADSFLRLWVGKLPDDTNSSFFVKTGLKWPD